MALDLKKLKARQALAKVGSKDFAKIEEGRTIFRAFTFKSAVTKDREIDRIVATHFREKKPIVCGRTPSPFGKVKGGCDLCEEHAEVEREEGQDIAYKLGANAKHVINAVILSHNGEVNTERRVVRLSLPATVYNSMMESAKDVVDADATPEEQEKSLLSIFGLRGIDFRITFDKKARPMYGCAPLPRTAKTEKLPADLLKDVKDLYADPRLNPEWYNVEKGLSSSGTQPSKPPADEEGEEVPAEDETDPQDVDDAPIEEGSEETETGADSEEAGDDETEDPSTDEAEADETESDEVPPDADSEEATEADEVEGSTEDEADGEVLDNAEEGGSEPEEGEEAPAEDADDDGPPGGEFDAETTPEGDKLPEGWLREWDPSSRKWFFEGPPPAGKKKRQVVWDLPVEVLAAIDAAKKPKAKPKPAPKAPPPKAKPAPAKPVAKASVKPAAKKGVTPGKAKPAGHGPKRK